MKAKTLYAAAGVAAILWFHFGADTTKDMVVTGCIGVMFFTLYQMEIMEERMNRMQATIERLWKRVEPSMFRDSGL